MNIVLLLHGWRCCQTNGMHHPQGPACSEHDELNHCMFLELFWPSTTSPAVLQKKFRSYKRFKSHSALHFIKKLLSPLQTNNLNKLLLYCIKGYLEMFHQSQTGLWSASIRNSSLFILTGVWILMSGVWQSVTWQICSAQITTSTLANTGLENFWDVLVQREENPESHRWREGDPRGTSLLKDSDLCFSPAASTADPCGLGRAMLPSSCKSEEQGKLIAR